MEEKEQKIVAYLENRLSPEEKRYLEQEINSSEELREMVNEYDFIRRFSKDLEVIRHTSIDKRWESLSKEVKKDKRKINLYKLFRNVAAILLLPLLLTSLYLYVHTGFSVPDGSPVEMVEITSAQGLVSKITLPDGSVVHLNSGSRLIYPQTFTQEERAVYLEGEAYFEVVSNKKNRFNVQVGDNLLVSAYGTAFNINGYADEEGIETVLTSGNVEVKSLLENSSCTLRPGQLVFYQKETGDMSITNTNLLVKTAWKDGKLIFRRSDMKDVIRRLSRHFNVDITLDGEELEEYEYSATFTTETLKDVLFLLEKSAPIQCRIIEPEQGEDYAFTRRQVIITLIK